MTARKFEQLAETKAIFDVKIRQLKPDLHADKIAEMNARKEASLKKVQEKLDAEKRIKIAAIKESIEARKKNLQMIKDGKLESLKEHSRRQTNLQKGKRGQLQHSGSRGHLQESMSASTSDISANNLNVKTNKV